MNDLVQNHWTDWLHQEFEQPYFKELSTFIHNEYLTKKIYPPKSQVFSAFENTDYEDIKVVILGQDPYHQKGQAHGMCFSVNPGVKIPPSLLNIYKELQNEYGCYIPNNGYLMPWAKQGVFLLNATLTVEDSHPLSHANKGWETFTDHAIKHISDRNKPVVFLLWGRNARNKAKLIDTSKHLVLEAAHPSPLSAYNGFFGCGHFKTANDFLCMNSEKTIDWQIQNL